MDMRFIPVIIILGMTLAACDNGNAQSPSASLEAACDKLSDGSEHTYHAVSGEVTSYRIMSSPGDCFGISRKCPPEQSSVSAHMKSLSTADDAPDAEFTVYTAKENARLLSGKPPYFEAGKSYAFCARGPQINKIGNATYFIDHVEYITTVEEDHNDK